MKKSPGKLKRPAAAGLKRPAKQEKQLYCSGRIPVPAALEDFREKVQAELGPSVPDHWVKLAFSLRGDGKLHDRFYCISCPRGECQFHGFAHYDSKTGEYKVYCVPVDTFLGCGMDSIFFPRRAGIHVSLEKVDVDQC